ncbi:VanW family protein [Anoxybacteroides tepidamans]|uniref:VanW family protein n=1 Tax=Anoxybacteroides tepidamans TaxID=265948 RepID=UPI000480F2A1|nr:VanW family protein [Anoxybacillus tepidamans]
MRPLAGVKLFLAIVVCTVYLTGFSQAAPLVYQTFFVKSDGFASGTMIGPVSIAQLEKNDAMEAVQKKINEWTASVHMKMVYQEKAEEIPVPLFSFRVEQSIDQAVGGHRSPLVVQLDDKLLSTLLDQLISPTLKSSLNQEQLKRDLLAIASQLQTNPPALDLANYVVAQKGAQSTPISEATMAALGDSRAEVIAWIRAHREIEMKGKSVFSLASYFADNASPEAMSMIGTAIYEAILPTNFTIVERHTSRTLPSGLPLGYEVKADPNMRDFRFYNPNASAYVLRFQPAGSGFHVSLLGLPFAYKYVVKTSDVEYFAPKTIVQYSPLLKPGERQRKQEGKQGMLVKVKKEIYDEHNRFVRSEVIAEDFYPPVYAIEVRGLEIGNDLNNENRASATDGQKTTTDSGKLEQQNGGASQSEQTPAANNNEKNESTQYEK